MAEQLSLFGSREAPSSAEPAPPSLPPAPGVDPRQGNLFEGHVPLLNALEAAFERFDLAAARDAWAKLVRRFPEWALTQAWPGWLKDLRWLTALERRHGAGDHAQQVLALREPRRAAEWLPGMREELKGRILGTALERAASRLLDQHGPGARLPDGRPAAYLLLVAGRPEEAARLLPAAVTAQPRDGRARGYLGEALWRSGRSTEALAAYRDAHLLAPGAVDEELSSCTPIHDLLDRADELSLPGCAGEWVAVLGDLEGVVPLPGAPLEFAGGEPASQAVVRSLASYRQRQRSGAFPDADRLALKREMLRHAPQLVELVRRL